MILQPLPQRRLGKSGILLSPVGLGTAQFSAGKGASGKYWAALQDDTARAIVVAAMRGGINWFDSAEYYGQGASEHTLADALHRAGKSPGDVTLATKWWPVLRSAETMKPALARSLKNLDGFAIDLYQVHQPYSRSTIRQQMKVMAQLYEAKYIRAVGVSNFSLRGMRAAHRALAVNGIPLASHQVHYSLLNRKIEKNGILAAARELGISIIAWSPLEQGLLTGKFHDSPTSLHQVSPMRRNLGGVGKRKVEASRPLVEAMRLIARRHEATVTQVALSWLLNFHGDTVLAIPGASNAEQARDNAMAMSLQLKPAELAAIDELSRRFM